MEITWLKNEDNAIQYVYASAVPQKIPLDIFKEIVQSSKDVYKRQTLINHFS